VILNLVVNARDAMPDGGSIRIRTFSAPHERAPGAYSVLEVNDSGVGMTPEILDQLFDPFFTTKEKGKGTGLGLATVYGIVKQSGGDISVRSVVGEGSSFRIVLPQASDQDASGVDSVRPGGGTECVLLVEDEDAVRALVRETLRRYGYEVTDAADADEARDALESLRPDILVTDIVMPGLGGHELATLVRERHPTVAVLYMSGYSDDAIVRSTLADPRSVFLQKPFGAETLARKVREALDARERV
jgi:two-component system, cell cycle sensor histidine kinase and response regulator CckA